ncbi:type II toxin-antitoxin system VapC family toxin [soil metagenome]
MSATVDANVLIYADNQRDPMHERARALIQRLSAGPDLLYLFWPTILGYLRIATHPGILPVPIRPSEAVANIDALLRLPHVVIGGESPTFWRTYLASGGSEVRGNLVPDAHLAALMRDSGVRILYTRDKGFRRFDFVDVRDPFTHRINEGSS